MNCSENPFCNDVIVSNLLKFCSYQDLKSGRLVSSQWNTLSRPIIRRRSKVTVYGDLKERVWRWPDEDSKEGTKDKVHLLEFLAHSLDPWQECIEMPFGHFSLRYWMFFDSSHGMGVEYGDQMLFWNIYGRSITNLELCACNFINYNALREVLCQKMPNLERLSLKDVEIMKKEGNDGMGRGMLPKLRCLEVVGDLHVNYGSFRWKDIFLQCPDLKILIIKNISIMEVDRMLKELNNARTIEMGRCQLNITHLEILRGPEAESLQLYMNVPPSILDSFENLCLPLEHLVIDYFMNDWERKRLIQMHSGTLKNTEEADDNEIHDVNEFDFIIDDDDEIFDALMVGNVFRDKSFWFGAVCMGVAAVVVGKMVKFAYNRSL